MQRSDMMFRIFPPRQCHFHVHPVRVDSSPPRRRHREGWVRPFQRAFWLEISTFHFLIALPLWSVSAFCSHVSACVLYISWMPIFTATVTFCPPVCPWYALSIRPSSLFFPSPSCSLTFRVWCFLCLLSERSSWIMYLKCFILSLLFTCWSGQCRSRAALGSSRKSPYTRAPTTPGEQRLRLSDHMTEYEGFEKLTRVLGSIRLFVLWFSHKSSSLLFNHCCQQPISHSFDTE